VRKQRAVSLARPHLVVFTQRKEDVYLLEFQDDEGEQRLVDARWVVPLPAGYGEKED
jgi:hypothetical protein